MITVPAMAVMPAVLMRAPIAASDAEGDVGVLTPVPLVLCAHGSTLYP